MNPYYISIQQMAYDLAQVRQMPYHKARELVMKYKVENDLFPTLGIVNKKQVDLGEQRLFKTPDGLLD